MQPASRYDLCPGLPRTTPAHPGGGGDNYVAHRYLNNPAPSKIGEEKAKTSEEKGKETKYK